MKTLEALKSRLIDRIMVARNEELLAAIEAILNSIASDEERTDLLKVYPEMGKHNITP